MSVVKWYKRDPNAALGGMMILSLEERGAYNTILDLIYSHDNNLIDDDRFIAGWMRCDLRVWRRIKKRLIDLGKIECKDGLVTNFRATCEVDEALCRGASVSELSRIKGIKSGIARNKNKGLGEPSGEPKTNTPTPTPTPRVDLGLSLARARDPLAELETKLRDAAGWQSEPAPMLGVTGPIQALIAAGADLDLDVLPTVKALAPSARSRTTWKYFLSAIAQARDDRVAASKIVSPQISGQPGGAKNGNHRPEPALSPRQAHMAKIKQRAIDTRLREISESGDSAGPDIQGPTGNQIGKPGLSRRPH